MDDERKPEDDSRHRPPEVVEWCPVEWKDKSQLEALYGVKW